jgi:hypothetical protein
MKEQPEEEDSISIKELIQKTYAFYHFLLDRWYIIVITGILGGILGLTYGFLNKPKYIAECTFVLDEDENSGLSQYAGIASMVGLDVGGGGSGLFKGDNIIQLYQSKSMLKRTLLSQASFSGKKELLVDRYLNFTHVRESWDDNPRLKNLNFSDSSATNKFVRDSVMSLVIKDIRENYLTVGRLDKKLSLISVKVISKDEQFSKEFTAKIVDNVNSFYIKYKTSKSSKNLAVLQRQADSIQLELSRSMGNAASAADANPDANPALRRLTVPSQRRQIDVQKNTSIYTEVEKNLFLTRMTAMKDAPLIEVVDRPELPLDKIKFGKLKGLIVGGFAGGFLAIFWIGFRGLLRKYIS